MIFAYFSYRAREPFPHKNATTACPVNETLQSGRSKKKQSSAAMYMTETGPRPSNFGLDRHQMGWRNSSEAFEEPYLGAPEIRHRSFLLCMARSRPKELVELTAVSVCSACAARSMCVRLVSL